VLGFVFFDKSVWVSIKRKFEEKCKQKLFLIAIYVKNISLARLQVAVVGNIESAGFSIK